MGDTVLADAERADVASLLEDAVSPSDPLREAAFRGLQAIGDRDPSRLCPHWDALVAMLDSPNAFHRAIGASVIARATAGDTEQRLDRTFDRWFALLDDRSLVVARYAAQNAARIAAARPDLAPRVVRRLLEVSIEGYPSSRAVLLSDVIEALDACLDRAPERDAVIRFVEAQSTSSSPKARDAARAFLKAHPS